TGGPAAARAAPASASTAATRRVRSPRAATPRRQPPMRAATPMAPAARSPHAGRGRPDGGRAVRGTLDVERTDRQRVGARTQEDVRRLVWRTDHRLAVDVQAGVEHDA